jgi:HK97 family phage portal protein
VIGALLSRQPATGDPKALTAWGDWSGSGSPTAAGVSVTPSSATQLLTVYGCDRFISDGISTLPKDTFGVGRDGIATETDPPDWVKNPTPDLDWIAWCGQALSSMLLGGDLFAYKVYARGELQQMIPIDPTIVEVHRKSGRKMYRINGVEFSSFEILHVPAVMFPGAERGMSPVEAARQSIGMGMAAQEFGGKFFGQGTTLSGVIEVPTELTPDQAREMASLWGKRHGGSSKSNLPGVLVGGAAWKPTQLSNEQSQFLETRGYTASEIAGQMFLIDPAEMGLPVQGTSLTYANLTERNERRVQVTFLPWIVRLEHALSALLPDGEYLKINTNGLLRGSTKTRWDTYKVGVDLGALEVGEIRALEDLPPLPDKPPAPPDLAGQIEAVGQLIRAGFDPAASLALFGLPPIAHTGLVPVTVTTPEGQ